MEGGNVRGLCKKEKGAVVSIFSRAVYSELFIAALPQLQQPCLSTTSHLPLQLNAVHSYISRYVIKQANHFSERWLDLKRL